MTEQYRLLRLTSGRDVIIRLDRIDETSGALYGSVVWERRPHGVWEKNTLNCGHRIFGSWAIIEETRVYPPRDHNDLPDGWSY